MKKIFTLTVMLFAVVHSFAQVMPPVVVGGRDKGDPNVTMEILSQGGKKGFMPPRLDQAQITTLQGSLGLVNSGVTVYNTDEKCLQSWNGNTWTECNPVLIAKFDIDCAASSIKGDYYKDVPVTNDEYLELSVVVKKAGSYTFVAESQNGVRFFFSSIISTVSATPQIIKIPAFGTPTATGTFNYTLIDQSGHEACKNGFPVEVGENNAVLTIDCSTLQVAGKFSEGKEVTSGDYITFDVNITKAGNYTFKTVKTNGLTFTAFKSFAYAGFETVILRPVAGSKPEWNAPDGIIKVDILDKDGVSLGCQAPVQVTSALAEMTVDCSAGVTVEGLLVSGDGITGANVIKIKASVTKIGPWALETNTVNGVSYKGSGIFTETGSGSDNEMVLSAVTAPTAAGNVNLVVTNSTTKAVVCPSVPITINDKMAKFAPNSCTTVIASGIWKQNTVIAASAKQTVAMNATAVGPYNLTATGGGITMTASGTVTTVGLVNVVFTAAGQIPNTSGAVDFAIVDSKSAEVCTIAVTITAAKGTKTNPGNSCLDILTDTPAAKDGEYWIKPTLYSSGYTGTAIKTFCDMTNGGYTLVWSYNENTAFNTYDTKGRASMSSNYYFSTNTPYNDQNNTSEVVDYTNFRLSLPAMKGLQARDGAKFKARIVSGIAGVQNMNDANAVANYLSMGVPTVTGQDFRYNTLGTGYNRIASTGKIWGKDFTINGNGTWGGTYMGQTSQIIIYHGGGYPFVLDWQQARPVTSAGNPNFFGWFGEANQEVNNHFFDCANGAETCSGNGVGTNYLKVSSKNRVLQWFIL